MNKLVRQAFTLIELLVVIAIIGILSGLIVVSMSGSINSANDVKRKANIDTIRKALIVYGTLNGMAYPTGTPEVAGCTIGGGNIPCTNLASKLSELLPNLPIDPVSGYYVYSSDGTSFTVSSILSTNKLYGYNSSTGYYSSIVARSTSSSLYNKLNNINIYTPANVDDSANGSLSGYVVGFSAGWSGGSYVKNSYGFSAGVYDIYARVRTNLSGNYPTSLSSAGVYNGTTSALLISNSYGGLTSSYKIIYIGRITINGTDDVSTFFSQGSTTTYYYLDYVEFRIVQ